MIVLKLKGREVQEGGRGEQQSLLGREAAGEEAEE